MREVRHRTIVDTNVLISALLFRNSIPAKCLSTVQRYDLQLASKETLDELSDVFLRPKFNRLMELAERIEILLAFRETLTIVPVWDTVQACRDPRDDKFLSLAVSGRANILISGDADLLTLHPFRGIAILSATDYLDRFRDAPAR